MQTSGCWSLCLYLCGSIPSTNRFPSSENEANGVGSASQCSKDTLALSPVCYVIQQPTLINPERGLSTGLCTFVPAGVSLCGSDHVGVKWALDASTFVIWEALQRNLHTPGQLRERSWPNISASCWNAHLCAKLLLWSSFTVGVHLHWKLTDHNNPLSFLLSHPCSNHINKPVRPNGWSVKGRFARGPLPLTVFPSSL